MKQAERKRATTKSEWEEMIAFCFKTPPRKPTSIWEESLGLGGSLISPA